MVTLSSVYVVFAASCLSAIVDGFAVVPGTNCISRTISSYSTQLNGRRVMKRGNLGSIDDEDTDSGSAKTTNAPRRSTRQQRKVKSSRKKKGGNDSKSISTASAMSPDLANFLEKSSDGTSVEVEVVQNKKSRRPPKSERRQTQSVLKVIDEERSATIKVVLDKLQEVLGEQTGDVRDILTVVEELLEIPSDNNSDLRGLLSGRDRSDYRLAWVGSDDAICHVGTGLHKVPLARMQEVFMNFLGRNKIEILEIVSIFGPFPNVKNVLQGTASIMSGSGGSEVQIVMDSMYDGTGKEIMAGKKDNNRMVDLEIAFFDERAIVVVMPNDDNNDAKVLDDDGKRVLLFVKEDDLDEKLELFRVNEIIDLD